MSVINQQIVTEAFQIAGIVDQNEVPDATQAANGLTILNDMLANEAGDGLRLGWYPQTSLTATAPLQPQDVFGVKLMLAVAICPRYGIEPNELIVAQMADAKRQMVKRSVLFFESDLSELPRAQSGPWGSGAGFMV